MLNATKKEDPMQLSKTQIRALLTEVASQEDAFSHVLRGDDAGGASGASEPQDKGTRVQNLPL